MSDQRPPDFQPSLEAIEGHHEFGDIPPPVNPLQAQTAFERRAWLEDIISHFLALTITLGFFTLALAGLLGYVDLKQPTVATAFGTIIGFSIARLDPIVLRYFTARARLLMRHPISNDHSAGEQGQRE